MAGDPSRSSALGMTPAQDDTRYNRAKTMKRLFAIAIVAWAAAAGRAQAGRAEYRAYWVETFRTSLATRVDVERVVDAAVRSNANALFVEVRRRGDSWYLDSSEPPTEVPGVAQPDAS